jgi:NRPS condensation-like uncharacterized protein
MSKKVSDPIAPWFIAVEALNEFIGMRFARIAPGKSEPEWIFVRHADYDGIGAIKMMFGERGGTVELPQAKHPARPTWRSFFRLLKMHLWPRSRLTWKNLGQSAKLTDCSQPPPAVAWHVFDEATTTRMRNVCRKADVTVNSFLLKNLTKTIRPYLEDLSPTVPWMIPVNLRGRVACERDTANHTSYLSVKVRPSDSVQDIHQNIHAAMEREEHCANWFAYGLGKFTTHGMRKFLIAKELATSQWNIGAFSNLGVWDPEKKITQPECLGDWLVCPPVLRFQLIGAGCLSFQGKLTLTIQTHPELTTDPAIPKAWMRHWVEHIEQELSGGLVKPVTVSGQRTAI